MATRTQFGSRMQERFFADTIAKNFSPGERTQLERLVSSFESEKLDNLLEKFGERVTPQGKEVGYSREAIEADFERVTKMQKENAIKNTPEESEQKFYASVLEMVIMLLSDSWLPGSFSKATKYDDYTNQVDLFLELHDGKTVFPMAVDATSSAAQAELKLAKISDNPSRSLYQTVKYYRSRYNRDVLTGGKTLKKMPRFIIGAEREEIVDLARLYLKWKSPVDQESRERHLKNIQNHPFGLEILRSVEAQIRMFARYETDPKRMQTLEKISNIIKSVKEKAPRPSMVRGAPERGQNRVLDRIESLALAATT